MLQKLFRSFDKRRRARTALKLQEQFFALQGELKPELFVEVGAYDGAAALRVRDILPKTRVVSFEANPSNHAHFLEQLGHANRDVEFIHSAISDEVGTLSFKIAFADHGGLSKKSSILSRSDPSKTQREVTVPATTLDIFFADSMPKRSSLWIDVEGASRQVLSGATKVLSTACCVLIEVETQAFWKDQWLADDTIAYLSNFGLEPIARDDEFPGQHNVLLVNKALAT